MSQTSPGPDRLAADGAALQRSLADAGPEERERILRDAVRGQAADILERTVEDDSNFLELGITSLKALELNRNLMALTGVEIPLVAIIEYPTPTQLARHVADTLSGAGAAQ